MAVIQSYKTKFQVATSATAPATAAAFKALSWVEVKEIEDIGAFGDTYSKIEVKTLGNRRTRKLKGTVDAGTIELKVKFDAADAGQILLRTALASDDPIYVRIELGDKPSTGASPTGSVTYLAAVVFAAPVENGDSENTAGQTFTLELTGDPIMAAPSQTGA